MSTPINVTVWNEFRHERNPEHPAHAIYPQGIHEAIASGLREHTDLAVRTATLDEPAQGLPPAVLESTDVLLWWGHAAHDAVPDELVAQVHQRVLDGMGLIVLHSGHFSKIFRRLMGTGCELKWREGEDHERLWVVEPGHPIAEGLGECIEVGREEMYGERFDIPAPETLVLVSWFTGGEVFRSGCCYTRGLGKVFYFRPGHESFPTYFHPDVRRVLVNAVRWAAPTRGPRPVFGKAAPRES
ncbi:MAG TPA: ThuA domain-containing protein [Chloroflexia bacterium]|jgi:trehalose utilization protein|nr:ThuA domain-containing protein [Chloroflexia bacterium]